MTITRNPREAALERVARTLCETSGRNPDLVLPINRGTDRGPVDDCARPEWRAFLPLARTVLDAAADGGWRPIEEADSRTEYELYFPAKKRRHLSAMRRIGCPADFPFRKPSHFAPLRPPPPVPQSAEDEG